MAQEAIKKGRKAKLGRKLAGYSAAAGAVLALGATGAHATTNYPINYLGPQPDGSYSGITIDYDQSYSINFKGTINSSGHSVKFRQHGIDFYTQNSAYAISNNVYLAATGNHDLIRFSGSKTIANSDFSGAVTNGVIGINIYDNTFGSFQPPDNTGFIGLDIKTKTGGDYYGWVNVTEAADDSSLTINSYAVGPLNTPITTPSPVPEPGTLVLLAIGAAGLVALRRKKISDEVSA